MKPLNSGQLRVLKNLSVIKRCPLLGGNLIKIVTFGMSAIGRFLCITMSLNNLRSPQIFA